MARIRTLKPAFWGDGKVSDLSRDARLLFVGLISMADDRGRFLASHQAVAGYVFPNDDDVTPARLRRWMEELTTPRGNPPEPLVVLYNGGRVRYGAIPKFRRHQRISKPQPSVLPAPPEDALFPAEFHT